MLDIVWNHRQNRVESWSYFCLFVCFPLLLFQANNKNTEMDNFLSSSYTVGTHTSENFISVSQTKEMTGSENKKWMKWKKEQKQKNNSPWCLHVWEGGHCLVPVQKRQRETDGQISTCSNSKPTTMWCRVVSHHPPPPPPHCVRATLSAVLCPNVAWTKAGSTLNTWDHL